MSKSRTFRYWHRRLPVAHRYLEIAAPREDHGAETQPRRGEPHQPPDPGNREQQSLLRKACSAEFLPEAAGRARVSGRDAAFAG